MKSKDPDSQPQSERPKISVAVPQGELRERLIELLGDAAVDVHSARPEEDLRTLLGESDADVVVVRRSQIPSGGNAVIDELTGDEESPDIVVLSSGDDPGERSRLVSAGVAGVLSSDEPQEHLQDRLEELAVVASQGGLDGPEVRGTSAEPRLADFAGRSARMKALVEVVRPVLDTDATLLILGETGVGKERLARAIHTEGSRRRAPFVTVNCAALSETLLDSELFGHVRGAFTGASEERRGRFELASGGTIFLDEIGDMPLSLQVKLLTVLQRHEVQRLGGEETIRVDVRVMAATHRDLAEAVAAGRFRQDLLYRLNVMPLEIPPLRQRPEDLPDLVGSFVRHFREALDKREVEGFSDEALEALLRYEFPGNVRELANIVERAMLLAKGRLLTLAELPTEIAGSGPAKGSGPGPVKRLPEWRAAAREFPAEWLAKPLREARQTFLASFEEAYLRGLLERTGGRVGETAELAGIATRSLYEKMRRYALKKEDFRSPPTGE